MSCAVIVPFWLGPLRWCRRAADTWVMERVCRACKFAVWSHPLPLFQPAFHNSIRALSRSVRRAAFTLWACTQALPLLSPGNVWPPSPPLSGCLSHLPGMLCGCSGAQWQGRYCPRAGPSPRGAQEQLHAAPPVVPPLRGQRSHQGRPGTAPARKYLLLWHLPATGRLGPGQM